VILALLPRRHHPAEGQGQGRGPNPDAQERGDADARGPPSDWIRRPGGGRAGRGLPNGKRRVPTRTPRELDSHGRSATRRRRGPRTPEGEGLVQVAPSPGPGPRGAIEDGASVLLVHRFGDGRIHHGRRRSSDPTGREGDARVPGRREPGRRVLLDTETLDSDAPANREGWVRFPSLQPPLLLRDADPNCGVPRESRVGVPYLLDGPQGFDGREVRLEQGETTEGTSRGDGRGLRSVRAVPSDRPDGGCEGGAEESSPSGNAPPRFVLREGDRENPRGPEGRRR
jgi:hypothetical protein